jgi:hypothetical protein
MGIALLYMVPSLLLVALLLLRRYPGEHRLVAAAEARRPRTARRTLLAATNTRPRARVPRGGLLIASALAVRPPPRLLGPA